MITEYKHWLSALFSRYSEPENFHDYLKSNHEKLFTQLTHFDDQDKIKIYQNFLEKNSVLLKKYCIFKLDKPVTRIQKILLYFQLMSLNDLLGCRNFIESMKEFYSGEKDMALHVIKASTLPLTEAVRHELDFSENNPICEALLLSGLYFGGREDPAVFLEEIEIALAQEIRKKQTGNGEMVLKPEKLNSLQETHGEKIKEQVERNEMAERENSGERQEGSEIDQEGEHEERESLEEIAISEGEEQAEIEDVDVAEALEQVEAQEEEPKQEGLESKEDGQEDEKEEDKEESEEAEEGEEKSDDDELEKEKKEHQETFEKTEMMELKKTDESKERHQEIESEKSIEKLKSLLKKFLPVKKQIQPQVLHSTFLDSEAEMFKIFKADTHLDEKLIDESIQKTQTLGSLVKTASLLSIPEAKIQMKRTKTTAEENQEDSLEDAQDEEGERF